MRTTSVMNLKDKFLEVKLEVQKVCAFKIDHYCQTSLQKGLKFIPPVNNARECLVFPTLNNILIFANVISEKHFSL